MLCIFCFNSISLNMPRSFEKQFGFMKTQVGSFVDETFKNADQDLDTPPEEQENEMFDYTPFSDRDTEEQMQLIHDVKSLVAKKRDLKRTIYRSKVSPEGTEVEDQDRERENKNDVLAGLRVIKQNGRFISVPSESPDDLLKDVVDESIAAAGNELTKIQKELAQYGRIPGLKEEYQKETTKLFFYVRVMREYEKLEAQKSLVEGALERLRVSSTASPEGSIVGIELKKYNRLAEMKSDIEERMSAIKDPQSIGPVLSRMLDLERYAVNREQGTIVEIPTAKAIIDQGLANLRMNQPFMIAGHLGGGKTEIARHIARIFMLEHTEPRKLAASDNAYEMMEPEFFSGAEEASVYDLVGKLKLTQEKRELKDIIPEIDSYIAKQQATGVAVDRDRVLTMMERVLCDRGATVTAFNYGPLGRAIKEGKPIIIDEINMMPQDVISRINDIALKKPGDRVRLQENGEEEFVIAPGFAIISTLNVGRQYHGTKEINAAFKSRWVSEELSYPSIEETFDLILVALMRKDRLRLDPNFPAEMYEKLIDLAIVVGEAQDLFTGKTAGQRFMSMTRGGSVRAEKSQLEKTVISTRDLMKKIIGPWKRSNFTEPLENILAKNILASAGIDAKDDQKFLTEIFIRRGFFADWNSDDFSRAGITGISDEELQTLQALQETDEYKKANSIYNDLARSARENSRHLQSSMLIGNQSNF